MHAGTSTKENGGGPRAFTTYKVDGIIVDGGYNHLAIIPLLFLKEMAGHLSRQQYTSYIDPDSSEID